MYTLDLQEMNQIHIDLFVTFSRTKIYLLTTKNKIERYADKLTEHRLIGVAKCSPEDEFDLETGKRIARARLLKRYYKKKEKVCLKVAEFAYQLTMFAWSMENYCADAYYEYLEEERV